MMRSRCSGETSRTGARVVGLRQIAAAQRSGHDVCRVAGIPRAAAVRRAVCCKGARTVLPWRGTLAPSSLRTNHDSDAFGTRHDHRRGLSRRRRRMSYVLRPTTAHGRGLLSCRAKHAGGPARHLDPGKPGERRESRGRPGVRRVAGRRRISLAAVRAGRAARDAHADRGVPSRAALGTWVIDLRVCGAAVRARHSSGTRWQLSRLTRAVPRRDPVCVRARRTTALGWPIVWSILAVGVFSVAYTSLGGLAADIWSDVAQFVLLWGWDTRGRRVPVRALAGASWSTPSRSSARSRSF